MANPWIKKMIKTPVFSTGEGVETFVKNTKETCRMEHILLILMVTMNGYYMINDLIYIYTGWWFQKL